MPRRCRLLFALLATLRGRAAAGGWYPVTHSRGGYIGIASVTFPKIKGYVAVTTPEHHRLMVLGDAYRSGDKRTPTAAELRRQFSDGARYLGAAGIAFYPWKNPLHSSDIARNPAVWDVARSLMVSNVGEVVFSR